MYGISRLIIFRCNRYVQRSIDRLVEYLLTFWTREQCTVFCRVRLVVSDDADEVVYRIGFVVFYGIQDMQEGLEDSVHARVGRLFLDYDEGVIHLHELCRYL